jgi:pimeloyl-ACP methyl ester carboxylesterase
MLVVRSIVLTLIAALLAGCSYSIDTNALYGATRYREPGTVRGSTVAYVREGLFLDDMLTEPQDIEFTIAVNSENGVWKQAKKDFIPATAHYETLVAPYGPLETVLIEANEISGDRRERPLFIKCHGNGTSVYNTGVLSALTALPYGDILHFEYPGYDGPSRRENRRIRTVENFDLMIEVFASHLNAQRYARPIILWGHSLGGLVCARLASKLDKVDGIILEATANDAGAIVRSRVPGIAKPFLSLDINPAFEAYNIAANLDGIKAPILLAGAGGDRVLPVKLSRSLADKLEAQGNSVIFIEFEKANHISIAAQEGFGQGITALLMGIKDQELAR